MKPVSIARPVRRVPKCQNGSVTVWTVLCMTAMIGIAALMINYAYLFVTRQEIHNAADSAALKGANHLYRYAVKNGLDSSVANFTLAKTEALNAAIANYSIGTNIKSNEVATETGYWDFDTKTLTQNAAFIPGIKVTITKTNLGLIFSSLLGFTFPSLPATAVAISQNPGSVPPGSLPLPVAILDCVYDELFGAGTVKIYEDGPYAKLNNPDCPGGSFASLTDSTSADTMKSYIDGSALSPAAQIGDSIWMGQGAPNTVLHAIEDCCAVSATNPDPKPVVIAVVNSIEGGVETDIMGFACIKVLSVKSTGQVQGRYIEVELIKDDAEGCMTGVSKFMGPNYGVYSPPRLVF